MQGFPRLDLVIQRGELHPYHHWFGQGLTSADKEARKLAEYFWTGQISQRPLRDGRSKPAFYTPVTIALPRQMPERVAVPVTKPVARKVKRSRASRIARRRR